MCFPIVSKSVPIATCSRGWDVFFIPLTALELPQADMTRQLHSQNDRPIEPYNYVIVIDCYSMW